MIDPHEERSAIGVRNVVSRTKQQRQPVDADIIADVQSLNPYRLVHKLQLHIRRVESKVDEKGKQKRQQRSSNPHGFDQNGFLFVEEEKNRNSDKGRE